MTSAWANAQPKGNSGQSPGTCPELVACVCFFFTAFAACLRPRLGLWKGPSSRSIMATRAKARRHDCTTTGARKAGNADHRRGGGGHAASETFRSPHFLADPSHTDGRDRLITLTLFLSKRVTSPRRKLTLPGLQWIAGEAATNACQPLSEVCPAASSIDLLVDRDAVRNSSLRRARQVRRAVASFSVLPRAI